jgi:hypothetical protein
VVNRRQRRRANMMSPMFYLRRTAVQKGALGGNKSWMVLLVFLYAPRLMRRVFGRTEVVIARERLLPGQFMRLEALPQLSKAERKAIKKGK